MRFAIPMCWFNRHDPKRDRVKWDGLNFIGHCRHCSAPIRRHPHGGWAKDWMETV